MLSVQDVQVCESSERPCPERCRATVLAAPPATVKLPRASVTFTFLGFLPFEAAWVITACRVAVPVHSLCFVGQLHLDREAAVGLHAERAAPGNASFRVVGDGFGMDFSRRRGSFVFFFRRRSLVFFFRRRFGDEHRDFQFGVAFGARGVLRFQRHHAHPTAVGGEGVFDRCRKRPFFADDFLRDGGTAVAEAPRQLDVRNGFVRIFGDRDVESSTGVPADSPPSGNGELGSSLNVIAGSAAVIFRTTCLVGGAEVVGRDELGDFV